MDNYYHAVFEAMKGIGDRLREMSGLTRDGAELVQKMFAIGSSNHPMFAINPLSNDSFASEQKGFVNLLVGMFGMFRNRIAHEPRVSWPMSEANALDMMSTMSLAHRKLDQATRQKQA
ncbi:MAG TPA: TIGR02391 family protein [Opitutus sp.]|nr:TIGR02391 family protein [Opitutus sp.]